MLCKADCGLRWIAALAGLGRIADCTLGALRCKDARSVHMASRPCLALLSCAVPLRYRFAV
eukprot:1035629-Alexandrium_andersonii.AAC.1